MYQLKAVIFDHSVLCSNSPEIVTELRKLIRQLKSLGLKIGAFSTHPKNIAAELAKRRLPPLDLWLTSHDVHGDAKGTARWFEEAGSRLNLARQEFLYIGDDDRDQRTAWNGGVVYLHATWSELVRPRAIVIKVHTPEQILIFASHFLLVPPRWQFKLDHPEQKVHARALMYAYTRLNATDRAGFTAHNVFQPQPKPDGEEEPPIKSVDAFVGEMLVLHALTSAYLEGNIEPNAFYTVFPSSRQGAVNVVLEQFVKVSSSQFKGYYRELLLRMQDAPDTSNERIKAKQENRAYDVNFLVHANTICLNPKYKATLKNRQVVVFDDFMTTGTSMEWARNLLIEAGAKSVLLLAVGKYRTPHRIHVLNRNVAIQPFNLTSYSPNTFTVRQMPFVEDGTVQVTLQALFEAWRDGEPYLTLPDDPFAE